MALNYVISNDNSHNRNIFNLLPDFNFFIILFNYIILRFYDEIEELPDRFERSYAAYKAAVLPLDDGSIWIIRDSNSKPPGYEPDALTYCANDPHKSVSGVEPESSAWKADVLAVTPHGQEKSHSRI